MKKKVGFVCFGEVNTPIERLQMKHDEALTALQAQGYEILDAGLVIDDVKYETADAAVAKLHGFDMSSLVICIAGWIPTHAVIKVTEHNFNAADFAATVTARSSVVTFACFIKSSILYTSFSVSSPLASLLRAR